MDTILQQVENAATLVSNELGQSYSERVYHKAVTHEIEKQLKVEINVKCLVRYSSIPLCVETISLVIDNKYSLLIKTYKTDESILQYHELMHSLSIQKGLSGTIMLNFYPKDSGARKFSLTTMIADNTPKYRALRLVPRVDNHEEFFEWLKSNVEEISNNIQSKLGIGHDDTTYGKCLRSDLGHLHLTIEDQQSPLQLRTDVPCEIRYKKMVVDLEILDLVVEDCVVILVTSLKTVNTLHDKLVKLCSKAKHIDIKYAMLINFSQIDRDKPIIYSQVVA